MAIADVREALAERVAAVKGLNRCDPYLPDQVNAPQAFIDLSITYDLVFGRNGDVYPFTITAVAARTAEKASQRLLDEIREPSGPTSLKTVVEAADTTLRSLVDDVTIKSASGLKVITINQIDYLAVEFDGELNF